jgi:hypothetical protein
MEWEGFNVADNETGGFEPPAVLVRILPMNTARQVEAVVICLWKCLSPDPSMTARPNFCP